MTTKSRLAWLACALFSAACLSCASAARPAESAVDPVASAAPAVDAATIDRTPANPNASVDARAVLAYLAALSTNELDGAVVGQNCGHGSQIADTVGLMGYERLVNDLHRQTGQWVGMISVDYEYERIFSPSELSRTNETLIDYWNQGGIVTINWSPHNPWLNDESNIGANPGIGTNTRNEGDNMRNVDLTRLVDPSSDMFPIWRRKLDRIAAALLELQAAGVVVLWRPMQEMNGSWFWWGNASHPNDAAPYVELYRDMYRYFTEVKGLNNLLWVYSPNAGVGWRVNAIQWAYPGADYVDVVAGTVYNDRLDILDYGAYVAMGKPLGIAEYGTAGNGSMFLNGTLDARLYAERIQRAYAGIAYWVCWTDFEMGEGQSAHLSVRSIEFANELMNDPRVITRERLRWREYR